jgi:hypothetical protein
MGKATITGGGANGLYNISIKYDNARAKARLDAINSQLDQLNNTLIPQALDNKNIAQAQHQVALGYLNSYLASVTPEQFDPAISGRLTVQAMQTKSVYDEANKAYKKLVLQETALEKEKTKLQNAPEDEAAQAWSADFTEDLTGDVGVIDVGYEDKDIRIIRPHAIEGAGYNAASDGIISSFFNHTAHQLYTNRAYLPALAKWKPRYRTGSITALSGDICSVTLDPYNSSQQSIDINQSTSLTGVPIEYMTCNGAAFEVGDSVVVDFGLDWNTPRVIGFVSNPRPCVQWPSQFDLSLTITFNVLQAPPVCIDDFSTPGGRVIPINYYYVAKDFDPNNKDAPVYYFAVANSNITESININNQTLPDSGFEIPEFTGFIENGVAHNSVAEYVDFDSLSDGETGNYQCYSIVSLDGVIIDTDYSVRKKDYLYPYIKGYDLASGYYKQYELVADEDILSELDNQRPTSVTLVDTASNKSRGYHLGIMFYSSPTKKVFRYYPD